LWVSQGKVLGGRSMRGDERLFEDGGVYYLVWQDLLAQRHRGVLGVFEGIQHVTVLPFSRL